MMQLWFGYILQVLEHPSEFKIFPSSHSSLPSTIPLPQSKPDELFMQVELTRKKLDLHLQELFDSS